MSRIHGSKDFWLAALRADGQALAEAIADPVALTREVPSCPGWTVGDLARHVGGVYRRTRIRIGTSPDEPWGPPDLPAEVVPAADDPAVVPWFTEELGQVGEFLEPLDPDTPAWNWAPQARTAGFWFRRMAHETAVHRADGQIAVGTRPVIDPVIAADGIAEWLGFLPTVRAWEEPERPSPVPEGKVVHFHVTDEGVDGEWLIRGGRGGVAVETGHGKGDMALRGPASDMLLVLLRRLPPDDPAVQVLGDRSLLDGWLAGTPF